MTAGYRKVSADMVRACADSGFTMQEAADHCRVDYQSIRKYRRELKKYHGICWRDGGTHVRAARRKTERATLRDAKTITAKGCTWDQLQELRRIGRKMMADSYGHERTPTRAFKMQHRNAHRDGIGWELTLWQWWTLWQESGHWDQRGRGNGYWMLRLDKSKPYAMCNVAFAKGGEIFRRKSPQQPEIAP